MKAWSFLKSSFSDLSSEVWWLAAITLINRAGSMVIPFLSLYLTEGLSFTLSDVGWILTAFGLGSVGGTWLGGELTDRFGNFKVMFGSLLGTGLMFIALQLVTTFWMWIASIFFIMLLVDAFRPALFVALNAYSKPENRTRSVTLIRLAINLGFSAGPAIGGWIIISMGYTALFWIDGVTCILAGIFLLVVLNPKRAKKSSEVEILENPKSPYRDALYWMFFLGLMLFTLAFIQYFSTMPIYYKDFHKLTESEIGMLLGLNGLLIFLFEMPLIKYLEDRGGSMLFYVLVGVILLALSFLVINVWPVLAMVILGMVLMTFGEMMAFPFSNAFAMERSKRGKQGQYLAMYSMAFSCASIFGHNMGMKSIEVMGYTWTWNLIFILVAMSAILFYIVRMMHIKESKGN